MTNKGPIAVMLNSRQPFSVSSVRKYIFFTLLFVTPAGFLFKFYSGPGHGWFNAYGAGLLYEIFWILVFFFTFPGRKSADAIPLWVFLISTWVSGREASDR